ncbi:hypothetical protein [Polaromonas sp. CG9_12]|nr:hypothetical protein [Polaromonas sp. CG9_12]
MRGGSAVGCHCNAQISIGRIAAKAASFEVIFIEMAYRKLLL